MTNTCPVCMAALEPGLSACPYCGFKLLGNTQEFKPISVDEEKDSGKSLDGAEAFLRVVRGSQIGMVYKLGSQPLSIGRNPQCDIFLNDMTVSRVHARIEYLDGCHVIFDKRSYNGVWVNNRSIDSRALEPGDHIQIGTFLLKYGVE